MFFKKKEMIQFSGRSHTRLGILAAVIGIIAVIGFIATSLVSSSYNGQGGIAIGIAGLGLFAVSLFGFYISLKALKERYIYYRFPIIGISTNGFIMITLMILYILGIA